MKKNLKKSTLLAVFFLFGLVVNTNLATSSDQDRQISDQNLGADSLLKEQFNRAINFYRKGEFQHAQQSYENAIQTIENGEVLDKNMIYRTYVNFGVLLNRLGDRNKALDYYNLAEDFTSGKFGNNSKKLIPIYINKGIIFSDLGNLLKAQIYFEKTLSLLEDHENLRWLSMAYNNLGVVFYRKDEYSKSLDYYLKTLELKRKNKLQTATTINNIANCYKKLGDYVQADIYYQKSIADAKKDDGSDYYLLGDYYLNYAVFQSKLKNTDEVLPYLNLAYNVYIKNFGVKHPDTAYCLLNFGDYYKYTKEYEKALDYYQKAIVSELENFQDTSRYANPDIQEVEPQLAIVEILKAKAGAFYSYYKQSRAIKDLDFALQTYDLCLNIIDKIRIAYQNEESKFELSENEKETYTTAIEIAVKLYQLTKDKTYKEKAFRYSERSKASSLLSSLNDVNAKNFGGIPAELQEQERQLKMDISDYRERVYEERKKVSPDREKISEWQNVLFNLNEKYNQMVLEFEEEYPEYYALKYDTKTIEIAELQKHLEQDDLLLEYSLSDSVLFTFVVSKDKFEVQRQEIKPEEFDFNLEEVRNSLKTNDFSNNSADYYKRYTSAAYKLYQKLILPNDSLVSGKKLLIVPDGKMAYIPFGVLLKHEADTSFMNYRNLDYLIKSNTITYQNSASLGFSIEPAGFSFSSDKSILAFAPSYENVDDSILYAERAYRNKLYPLPGTKEEVNNISKVMAGDIYIDDLATEKNFKENAGKYDVLHLAMHTIIDDQNPMYSKLVFTQVSDTMQDGLLNTHEIYNMNFNARMVVLSACSTGDGKLLKGEGVMSLARGFFYAGCPSIIMTLWTVEDQTGSNLMTNFYGFLAQGLEKDAALRQAKLEYLKTADPLKSHPYFWSGYVSLGDVEPLYNGDFTSKLLYFLLGTVLIAILFYFYTRRRLKKVKI